MLIGNETTGVGRWYLFVIALTGLVVFSSCMSSTLNVSSTLNTTGSTSMTDNEASVR